MSPTSDLSAPAPASVGRSQSGTTFPCWSWPFAIQSRISPSSVMPVMLIPSGSSTRSCITSS